MSERPSFSAPLYAAVRQGAKELAQVLPAFPESVRPVEEANTLGNPTQALLTAENGALEKRHPLLEKYDSRGEQAQDDRGMER